VDSKDHTTFTLKQEVTKLPLSHIFIFRIFTYSLINVAKKKTLCPLQNLNDIKHIDLFSSDHTHFFFKKQNKMVCQTLEKNGMASRAVFRIIISEISIWLFLPLAGFNTSSVTFLGLKQK
jgi:hypothetical protein